MRASRLALAAAALIALVAALWLLAPRGARAPRTVVPEPAVASRPDQRAAAPLERAERATSPARERLALAESEPEAVAASQPRVAEQPAAPPRRVRGSVLGLVGEPLGGVPLALEREPERELARSRPDGGFELVLQPLPSAGWAGACLSVSDARWAVVRTSCVGADERPLLVVLAPAVSLAGRVVDEQGAAVVDADLRLESGPELFAGFPQVLDGTAEHETHATTSDAQGSFALERCPSGAGLVLAAYAPGFLARRVPVPTSSRADLELVLARDPEQARCAVVGTVRRADGSAAGGASVRLGQQATQARADGSFRLGCGSPFDETPLVAWLPGLQPAVLERFGERARAATDASSAQDALGPIELVLGPPALALAGRLLDARGEPLAGWEVSLAEGTPLDAFRMPPELLEAQIARTPLPVLSDSEGAFRIAGLLARRYVVHAWERASLLSLRSEPVEAGRQDLELRLGPDAVRERLAGTVVSLGGLPLAGASVRVQMVVHQADFGSSSISGDAVRCDESGRFELRDVPREELIVSVGGPDLIPQAFAIAAHEPDDGHVLRVAARCHFRVAPADGEPWASFALEDADGHELQIFTFNEGGWGSSNRVELGQGATRPYAVSEEARTLVLFRQGAEATRTPVQLVPGEVSVLRP